MKKNKIKIIPIQYRRIQENFQIDKKIDSLYYSYWLGKFFNFFIKKGKKQTVYKHLYLCLLLLKFSYNYTPLVFWFEMLEQIKPTFKLISIFPRKKMIIYPRIILGAKQYNITLRWIKEVINNDYFQSRQTKTPFYKIILSSFEYLKTTKNRTLIKKRDNYLNESIRLQDNIRFTWSKS